MMKVQVGGAAVAPGAIVTVVHVPAARGHQSSPSMLGYTTPYHDDSLDGGTHGERDS